MRKVVLLVCALVILSGCSQQNSKSPYEITVEAWAQTKAAEEIARARAETVNVTAQLHVSQQQTANITADLHNANREIEQLKAQLARSYTQQDIDGLREALKGYAAQYEALNNQYVELQGMYSKLFHDNQELQKSYDKLKKESENWTATDWKSLEELEHFLVADNTDRSITLVADSDGIIQLSGYCEDQAFQLRNRAGAIGKRLEVEILDRHEYLKYYNKTLPVGQKHAINKAVIGNEWWYIDPGNDRHWLAGYLD